MKNVNHCFGKSGKKNNNTLTDNTVRQLCTSSITLCFSGTCQVNTANSLCRLVCRMAADLACAVHWTVAQCMWQKTICAPLLLSPWSSVSIPPVSEVVFALQKKKKRKTNRRGPLERTRLAHPADPEQHIHSSVRVE